MGKIEVKIQTEDRLRAITELAEAVNCLAKALGASPQISVTGCTITGAETGIEISTEPEITETLIREIDD